jgi:hypothetical protein
MLLQTSNGGDLKRFSEELGSEKLEMMEVVQLHKHF